MSFLGTFSASAHIRWFVQGASTFEHHQYPVDRNTLLILLGAFLFIGFALLLHFSEKAEKAGLRISGFLQLPQGVEWRIVSILTGIMLVSNASQGVFLAPNLEFHHPALMMVGAIAQVILGLMLLSQLTFVIPGIVILLVAGLSLWLFPIELLIDYLAEFAALALALIWIGPSLSSRDRKLFERFGFSIDRFADQSLPLLRAGVGLTLIILALHNKLFNPSLTMAFLEIHPLNFMPFLGFSNFTDLHFSFAAGIAELTFGLLLLFGIATRFTTGFLSFFFLATLLILGPIELVGHAPLFGISLLLIIQGSGKLKWPKKISITA